MLSKDEIKADLLRKAAAYWDINNVSLLDPFVKLIVESLSHEIFKLQNEIHDMESGLLARLAEILTPLGLRLAQPAHAIIHARSIEPVFNLDSNKTFSIDKIIDEKKEEISFRSVVNDVLIIDGDVDIIVTPLTVYKIKNGLYKQPVGIPDAERDESVLNNEIWIGLQLHEEIDSIKGLSFFTNLIGIEDNDFLLKGLPLTAWYMGDSVLKVGYGIKSKNPYSSYVKSLIEENIAPVNSAEVREIYNSHFVTLEEDVPNFCSHASLYPEEFGDFFSERTLKSVFTEPKLWIKIKFPVFFSKKILDTIIVSINSFPVFNVNKRYMDSEGSICSISTKRFETFLSIDKIHNDKGEVYKKSRSWGENSPLTYIFSNSSLERFDSRNAEQTLNYLFELIKDEVSAFYDYPVDKLQSLLANIQGQLEEFNILLDKNKHYGYGGNKYLLLNNDREKEIVYIDYWTTYSEYGNDIDAGSVLKEVGSSDILPNTILFLTGSFGGKPEPDEKDLIYRYHYAISTNNRIISLTDIENFVHIELGNNIGGCNIRPGIFVDSNKGIEECIDIILSQPNEIKHNSEEKQLMTKSLKAKLQVRSSLLNNYRVYWDEDNPK